MDTGTPRHGATVQRRMDAAVCHGCRSMGRPANWIGRPHEIIVSWGRLTGRFRLPGKLGIPWLGPGADGVCSAETTCESWTPAEWERARPQGEKTLLSLNVLCEFSVVLADRDVCLIEILRYEDWPVYISN